MLRSFLSKSSKADATPAVAVKSGSAKSAEPHPLDSLTGGAFSAPTSGERASRIRQWLTTEPTPEQMAEVYKDLANRDKGAAKPLKEKLDEVKRSKGQEAAAAEWAEKARALLALPKLNLADALAWQRQVPSRWLLVEGSGLPECVDTARARDMGNTNRRRWWLLPAAATQAC